MARRAREHAYCPYSNYAVGAALRLADGTFHTGSNVENASYGLSICAERAAVFAAAPRSLELTEIVSIAIIAGPTSSDSSFRSAETLPCGACLQVLSEFAGAECRVVCAEIEGDTITPPRLYRLGDLLPKTFDEG
jgi:homotetrameric cytidine deaminase